MLWASQGGKGEKQRPFGRPREFGALYPRRSTRRRSREKTPSEALGASWVNGNCDEIALPGSSFELGLFTNFLAASQISQNRAELDERLGLCLIIYAMRNKVRLIYRYANRKLYDTASKTFVNLAKVLEMAREGLRVKVLDRRTGRDITRPTLLKALAAEAERLAAGAWEAVDPAEIRRLVEELRALRKAIERLAEEV